MHLPSPLFVFRIGQLLAERARAVGIDGVQWRRKTGQKFHGRIASLLTSMQDYGLKLV
jgi:ribosomal protein L18